MRKTLHRPALSPFLTPRCSASRVELSSEGWRAGGAVFHGLASGCITSLVRHFSWSSENLEAFKVIPVDAF